MDMTARDRHPVGDLIKHLRELLARYASKENSGEAADKKGVTVLFSKSRRHMIAFVGATEDKIGWRVEFDINKTSREYIRNMIASVHIHIQSKRKERHASPIILPGRLQ